MGSTRLPGKVLLKICGKTVLNHLVDRVRQCRLVDEIIVATTTNTQDDKIVDECKKLGVSWFRGSEDDVLSRYYYAARQANTNVVIRITSDNPLCDPVILCSMIDSFISKNNVYDYMSNNLIRSYPRGLDVEIMSFSSLEMAFENSTLNYEREHVTPYLYEHAEMFKLKNYQSSKDYSEYRLTIDTEEDFQLVKEVITQLYVRDKYFQLQDIIDFLSANPELVSINQYVKQKKLSD